MNDQDLFKAFKESSETDRDFDYKSSGWYKVSRLLNYDDQKRKRKWLSFLPWLLAGSMLGLCVFMYKSQSNSNKQIKELIVQMNNAKTISADTITTTKYIYIYDTIVTKKIIYVESASVNRNEVNRDNASRSSNPAIEEKSTTNRNQDAGNILIKSDAATILPDDNNIEGTTTNKKALTEIRKFDDTTNSNTNDDLVQTTEKDSIEISAHKQETIVAVKHDSLLQAKANNDYDNGKLTEEKKEKDDRPKFKMITELGAYTGILLPAEKNMVYQLGYNAGIGCNVYISPNFLLQFKGAYSRLYFETKHTNNNIGISLLPSPNPSAGYVFETATSGFSFFNAELGLHYLLSLKYKFNPIIGISYGGRFLVNQKANYTFFNNINEDIVVESERKSRAPVWNQIVPSFGFNRAISDKWKWYFTGFYNWNTNTETIAPPNYFGLNTSFYYKF